MLRWLCENCAKLLEPTAEGGLTRTCPDCAQRMLLSYFSPKREGAGKKHGIVGLLGVVAALLLAGVFRFATGGISKSGRTDTFFAKPGPSDTKSVDGLHFGSEPCGTNLASRPIQANEPTTAMPPSSAFRSAPSSEPARKSVPVEDFESDPAPSSVTRPKSWVARDFQSPRTALLAGQPAPRKSGSPPGFVSLNSDTAYSLYWFMGSDRSVVTRQGPELIFP